VARREVSEHVVGEDLVVGHARDSTHIPDVEQVVGHAAALGRGQLGGADVHAAIELHRVGIDDLPGPPQGEFDGEVALSHRGRADDQHWVRRHLLLDAAHGRQSSLSAFSGAFSRLDYAAGMGFLDKLKKQAGDAVDKHGEQIAKGLDKAAGLADAKTKGKHSDQIGKGVTAAKSALDKLDDKNDDIPDEPPPAAPRTP